MGILALIVFAIAIAAMVVVFLVKRGKEDELETKPSVEPEKPTDKPVEKPKEPLQEPQKPKVDNDKPESEKEPEKPKEEPKPEFPDSAYDDIMNRILFQFSNIVDVKKESMTYNYLLKLLKEAEIQYYKGESLNGIPPLYKEENFPQIYDFYGEDGNEYDAFMTLVGWLFAMQLTELRHQDRTAIYKIGYEIGGCDKDSKLYGWKFKCDPNICRMVASAIYAAMRGVCKPDVDSMQEECGGISIPDTIEDVRESDSFDLDHSYYIDLREFMPTAPGPYAPGYQDRSQIGGYPFPNDAKMDDGNLAIDRAIRDWIVEQYNLNEGEPILRKRVVQAIADKDANYNHLFGRQRNVDYYVFNPVFTKDDLGQDVYPSLAKELCEIVDDVLHIGSYQRCILQGNASQMNPPQYGRLRPGCSWQVEAHRHSDDDDRQNVLVNFPIEENDGNPTGYYDKDGEWTNKDGIHSPEEYEDVMKDELWANSYPSGHSAVGMSTALLLIELLPKQADKILAAANRFAVNRTIARYHWNSDTIQGRVLATCVAPIIRCCSDWKERFEKAKECLK